MYQRLLFHRYKWSWTHFVFYSTNLPYFCSISNHLSVIGLKCFDSFICWVSCVSSWHTSCIFYPSVALFCLQYDNTNQSSFVISFLDLLKYCPVFISVKLEGKRHGFPTSTAVVSISANNIGFLQLPFFLIVTADKYRGFLPIKLHLAIFNEILYFAAQLVLAHT